MVIQLKKIFLGKFFYFGNVTGEVNSKVQVLSITCKSGDPSMLTVEEIVMLAVETTALNGQAFTKLFGQSDINLGIEALRENHSFVQKTFNK